MGGSVVFAKKEEAKVVEMVEEAPTAPVKKPVVQENVDDIDAVLSIFKR
jgi:hypothetical protein